MVAIQRCQQNFRKLKADGPVASVLAGRRKWKRNFLQRKQHKAKGFVFLENYKGSGYLYTGEQRSVKSLYRKWLGSQVSYLVQVFQVFNLLDLARGLYLGDTKPKVLHNQGHENLWKWRGGIIQRVMVNNGETITPALTQLPECHQPLYTSMKKSKDWSN